MPIQNPYNGGGALMLGASRMQPLQQAGEGISGLSQSMNKYELADMMQANGGLSNASMNPIAMLADKQTMGQFNTVQDLARTDRGLNQQDTQLGISQQNADTSSYGADTSRMNYNLNNNKFNTEQTGWNQLGDALRGQPGNIRNNIASVESGGNYNAKNPNSSASGKYQMVDKTRKALQKRIGMDDATANTPFGQEALMDTLMGEQASQLKSLGLPVNQENSLALHQMGYPDFVKWKNGTLTGADKSKLAHLASYQGKGGASRLAIPKGKIGKQLATLMSDEYGKQTANEYDIKKADAKANNTASSKLFGEQVQAKIDMLKSQNKNSTNQSSIDKNNQSINALAQLGGTIGDTTTLVDPDNTQKAIKTAKMNTDLNYLKKNQNVVGNEAAVSYIGTHGNMDGIRDEVMNDDYMGAQTPRVERDNDSRASVDSLIDKGYDSDWYGGPFNSQKEKWDRFKSSLATVADKSMKSSFINEDIEDMNKYANKIGIKIKKTDAGSNIFRTKNMDDIFVAEAAVKQEIERVASTLVDSEDITYEEATTKAKQLLNQNDNFIKLKKRARRHGYPSSAFKAAEDLEAE